MAWLVLLTLLQPTWATDARLKELQMEELHEMAPELRMQDHSGLEVGLSNWRGKFVLLHLWATWCKPCRVEMPSLQKYVHDFSDPRLVSVFVSVDPEAQRPNVEIMLKDLKITQTPFVAVKDEASERYHAWGIPMTYLIDPSGKILARHMGMQHWDRIATSPLKSLMDSAKTP